MNYARCPLCQMVMHKEMGFSLPVFVCPNHGPIDFVDTDDTQAA